jgi:hypothetical protein
MASKAQAYSGFDQIRVAVVARDDAVPCDACEPVLAEPVTR